jgi:hypothetical protein
MARRFGYSRVSTSDQDWSLQLEALTKAGVDDRDIFREKASGAKRDRSELRRMLDLLRPGDQATVYRLDHHIQGTSSGHDAARSGVTAQVWFPRASRTQVRSSTSDAAVRSDNSESRTRYALTIQARLLPH